MPDFSTNLSSFLRHLENFSESEIGSLHKMGESYALNNITRDEIYNLIYACRKLSHKDLVSYMNFFDLSVDINTDPIEQGRCTNDDGVICG